VPLVGPMTRVGLVAPALGVELPIAGRRDE